MKLILTGATGAAGLEVLRAALIDPAISKVTVLSRRPLPSTVPASEKIEHITHSDFLSYPSDLVQRLSGHGACIWALGKSSSGMSEADYTELTHDYPVAAFKAFNDAGIRGEDGKFRFVYFSGEGADPEGKSRILFARVKGRTETDLAAYASTDSTLKAHNIRPGYFFPSNPIDAAAIRSSGARILDRIMSPMLFTLAPSVAIKSQDLGRFAVEVAKGTFGDQGLFTNKQMVDLLKEQKKGEKKE